ncbi:M20/M25/M40 family metallo-hydrolase [Pseudoduganella sp. GCM10020061]|uniref:M20/M25/M40 family metallo-hydrolase n=1 Tax=Pseudoduganella sp. GCM10020061 TaxID=3317345 RepID=UPI003640AED4
MSHALTCLFAIAIACAAQAHPAAPTVDREQLFADARTLSSPAYEGRRTGTPGNRKAREYLEQRLRATGIAPLGASFGQPFSFTRREGKEGQNARQVGAVNLVGLVRGTRNPERYIVLSAHYDHLGLHKGKIHPGADDNASGVAVVLAAARWFRANPPEHSIVFALFDGEEMGLRGAKHFVSSMPLRSDTVVANLNFDMVGRNDKGEINVAGTSYTPALRAVVDQAAQRSGLKVSFGHDQPKTLTRVDDWTQSSDHGAFHDAGIPFLYFGVEDHADYHGPGDTFENLTLEFFRKAAQFALDTAVTLDRSAAPAR